MARRDQTPPYEIMRSRGASGGAVGAGEAEPQGPGLLDGEVGSSMPSRAPWWVGSSSPLVLRLPRGLAVLAVVGVLGVIVVAYWVGTIRGSAVATPNPQDPGMGERSSPGWYEADSEEPGGQQAVAVPDKPTQADKREPGMCYIRLMTSSREDCQALAKFMGGRGVAIQLVPRDNSKSWYVYAVDRAYRPDEIEGEPAQFYLNQVKNYVREWKNVTGGRVIDLHSIRYFQCVKPSDGN